MVEVRRWVIFCALQPALGNATTAAAPVPVPFTGAGRRKIDVSKSCRGLSNGGSASDSLLGAPSGLAIDPVSGSIFIADAEHHRVCRLDPKTGRCSTVAGQGCKEGGMERSGYTGDGGLGSSARLRTPVAVAVHGQSLYVADASNHAVRGLNLTSGIITSIAGVGYPGYDGDEGLCEVAMLNFPAGLALDARTQRLYIADLVNNAVRVVDIHARRIGTLIGPGATAKIRHRLHAPLGLALMPGGRSLLVSERDGHRVWRISLGHNHRTLELLVGRATPGFEDGPARVASLHRPAGLAIDSGSGDLYIADQFNHAVRVLSRLSNDLSTVAGDGRIGPHGGGGHRLRNPLGVAVHPSTREVFVAERGSHIVRSIASLADRV